MPVETPQTLSQREIAELIPHGDGMSLLDQVISWDNDTIKCRSAAHLRCDNPLLKNGKLATVILVEYGAQAAAVHAGLLKSGMGEKRAAYLGSVKKLTLGKQWLEAADTELLITANCEMHSPGGAIYEFTAHSNEQLIAKAKLILIQPK